MNKKIRRRLTVLAISGAAIATAVVAITIATPNKHPQYLSAPVTRGDLENAVLATGALQAFRQVDVGAQVSGQLKTLKVKLGDKVTKGQWLAEIDPVISENALRQARASEESLRAQQQSAAAQLTQAELAFRRQQAMLPDDATSRESFEAAKATLDVQRATVASLAAQIRSARIQIETAQANLGYTRIVAPIDGQVVAIVTQEGQTVIAQQQAPVILKLANLDTMTVKAQVSEADVIRVSAGQTAYFTSLGEPDKRHYGKLRAIEPAPQNYADAQSPLGGGGAKPNAAVFYNALFDVPNPEHRLRIAMTAQVNIVLGDARNALIIPAAALGEKRKDGTVAVRVLRADGSTETRHVRIGINNNVRVEVLAGLKDGERVVIGEASADERVPLSDVV
ncbi:MULTISPECIES: macrolide transporter subunit MacA [Burkholderia]|uniref:Macrolide transporter subunit MacA n=1 Tax=Burkholderia sola TaxID=2843302 RepID=A0ABV2CEG0_9BURK|nr:MULTISPECIES: macrolide transporter subunit MacA [Burkholderia]KWU16757.1 hemolysin secretion protein D [Burkholderia cenocepacia]MBP0609552.1 macrolide transporter subunit MacA [Burkholderia sp. CpTa8-5]OXI71795.1 macrolide transporter subunit MacA [Burkholderia sp. AU31280]QRR16061.1 macrolide transporter subunit MacA [Burkholderia sp. MS389]QVN14367.1 macrolide transporter subunit MacA [Burkholderia sp. LAS2]